MTAAAGAGMRGLVAQQAAALVLPHRLTAHQAILRANHINIPQAAQRVSMLEVGTEGFDFTGGVIDAPQR